ncbi:uncharacterized protein LOC135126589 isoform X2 [Zophobas morio]|uniref:uncharacterized protein LOC135126589 isoform X2 n=1 Tax=Zophobas morio TaxID=2755281 RepID=UPI0030835F9B
MNEANIFCIKFDFGIPLEDIFPSNSIHPRLHNLFWQASVALKQSNFRLKYVLNQFEGTLSDVLDLKETLVNGKLHHCDKMPPSSLFWLLRHFLGLLPLPLFPHFTDGRSYNWEYLATQCRLSKMDSDAELESEIAWWVHRLPKVNIMLIYTLINFLRKISTRRRSSTKLNWENIMAATTYFGPSLFVRPYRPGIVTKSDTLYFPLLCYLIVHWTRIRREEHDCFRQLENKLSSIWEHEEPDKDKIKDYNELLRYRLLECGCQTSAWLLTATNDKDISDEDSLSEHKHETPRLNLWDQEDNEEVKTEQNEDIEEKQADSIENNLDTTIYEEISNDKINSNSETVIYKQKDRSIFTPNTLKKKLVKANISLVNVISKVNEKLKSGQELLKSRSGTKVDNVKYDLLKDLEVKKVQSLQVNHVVTESPNIKYQKLMTL